MIPALQGIGNQLSTSESSLASSAEKKLSGADPSPFGELLKSSIENITQLEGQANAAVNGLMTGSGIDVHQAMIAAEKASMAFELALAVRNKAIQSYQSVMSMQF